MKRTNQDDSQDATARGKQARTHGQPAGVTLGSHTVVQPASVLALQPHIDGDDMNVDSDHELDHEDATSMDEDLDQDSDLEGELTNQVYIVSYVNEYPSAPCQLPELTRFVLSYNFYRICLGQWNLARRVPGQE